MNGKRIVWSIILIAWSLLAQTDSRLDTKLQRRISLNLDNVPVAQVVEMLAAQHQLNVVFADQVKGNVSVSLKDVAVKDALTAVLLPVGAHFIVEDNLLIVKPFASRTPADLRIKVFQLQYRDATDMARTIKPLLSDRGKVEVLVAGENQKDAVKRADVLVVQDYRQNIEKVAEVIARLDKPVPQIHIEVRLVETNLGAERRIGLNLPTEITVKSTGAENTLPYQNLQGTTSTLEALSGWYELPANVGKLNLGILSVSELQATLSALAKDDNTRLVSSPSVIAMNNRKAVIKIGTSVPIPQVSRGISGDLFSYEEKEVNMYLEVIPRINENHSITMEVHPILEEIVGYVGPSDFPQPIISRREVQTQVMVADSQTVVIGGLIKENTIETVRKVWLLGDVPLLKYLFRHKQKQKQKTNLLIFITPRIIKP